MSSDSRPPAKTEEPLIPPLTLESCETGGGWGVGEIFARLPPAQVQAKSKEKLYRVANTPAPAHYAKSSLSSSVKAPPTLGSLTAPPPLSSSSSNGVLGPLAGSRRGGGGDRSLTEGPSQAVPSPPPASHVPIVTYTHQDDDDDNTFVDHGSVSTSAPAGGRATGNGEDPVGGGGGAHPLPGKAPATSLIPPWTSPTKPNLVHNRRVAANAVVGGGHAAASRPSPPLGVEKLSTGLPSNDGVSSSPPAAASSLAVSPSFRAETAREGGTLLNSASTGYQRVMSAYVSGDRVATVWRPPRIVSQLLIDAAARDFAVSPDGGSIWAVFGDYPPTLFEIDSEKNTLESVRSVNWVTQVYCMAVVATPTAKRITFKSVTPSQEPGSSLNLRNAGKRKDRSSPKSSPSSGVLAPPASGDTHCTYALWCGLSRGNINIVDLHSFTDAGVINSAHDQAVNKIWYLENGRVWTAGRDKALKVWDPQTRRMLKKRNIAAVLSDLCYVCTTYQVWAIADDAYIRVYEAGGNNVRIQKRPIDHAENALKMRSDVSLITYHQDGNFVWAGMSKNTALIDPRTFAICQTLLVTLTALVFHKKTAIICGHGPLLLDSDTDSVAILDITNPVEPSLLFSGFRVNAPSRLGIHLLTAAQPFAILECYSTRNDKKTVCMFTYKEFNGGLARDEENIPPQRKIKGGIIGVVSPSAPPSPLMNSLSNAVISSRVAPNASANRQTTSRAILPASSNATSSPVLNSNIRHALPMASPTRVSMPPTGLNGNFMVGSAEVSSALDQMEKKLEEVRKAVAVERREKGPLSDFSKLHSALTKWIEVADYAPPALPPSVVEELSREYETPEGKALAIAFARLQGAVTGRKQPAGVAAGSHGSELGLVASPHHLATPFSKSLAIYPTGPAAGLSTHVEARGGGGFAWPGRAADASIHVGGSNAGKDSNPVEQMLLNLIKEERQTHQAQMQSLQQHNSRILARLETFTTGVKDLVSRTVELYQDFKNMRMNGLPQDTLLSYDHLLEVLAQTPPFSMTSCSTREEIADLLRKQATASERNLHALKEFILSLHRAYTIGTANCGNSFSPLFSLDGSQRLSVSHAQPSSWPRDLSQPNAPFPVTEDAFVHPSSQMELLSSKTPQPSTVRGSPVFRWAPTEAADRASELEWYFPSIACSDLSQGQLIRLIGEVIGHIEESMKQMEGRWHMLKQSRRQVIKDLAQDPSPPLQRFSEDFMQCTAVWDLSVAEVCFQLCKDEALLVIMESLLEWRREAHPRGGGNGGGAGPSNGYDNPFQGWVHTFLSTGCRKKGSTYPSPTCPEGRGDFAPLRGNVLYHDAQSCGKLGSSREYGMGDTPIEDGCELPPKGDWISDDDTCYNASNGSESSTAWMAVSQQVSMLSLRMESVVGGIRTSLQQEIGSGEKGPKSLFGQEMSRLVSASEPGAAPNTAQEGIGVGRGKEAGGTAFDEELCLGLSSPDLRCFVKIHTTRLDGFLHWAQVGVYLTTLCLNIIRALIYPTASLLGIDSSVSSPIAPPSYTIKTGNFLVMNKKLIDCAYFLSNLMTYAYVTRCVLVGWQTAPKSSMPTNNSAYPDASQFSFSNTHKDPVGLTNNVSTVQRLPPNGTLQSPTCESVLLNSMDFDSAANNSRQSQDCHSNLKGTFGCRHSNGTSRAASEDISIARGWVRRDLYKRQWASLLSFYTQLILRQQIPPELFLPSGGEKSADEDAADEQNVTEGNGVIGSEPRPSSQAKPVGPSQDPGARKSGRSRHTNRKESGSQQAKSYISKYADKVSALFEVASSALEYCHQLEKRMRVIGKENSGEATKDVGGSKDQTRNVSEGGVTRAPNTVVVSCVSDSGCLRELDSKAILSSM